MEQTEQPTVPSKGGNFWRGEVSAALAKRQRYEAWWEACLQAYAPWGKDGASPESYGGDVHTNRTFTLTERKKTDLFYRRPDVTLQPTPLSELPIVGYSTGQVDPQTQQPATVPQSYALAAHEEIVNEKLGEDGIDAVEMMDAVNFDIVCTQGVGFTKMGYEQFSLPTETADPVSGETRMVEVPIAAHCYWEHFSGKQAIIPASWRSTQWDKAPYLGVQFELPLTLGNRLKYKLPPDFQGSKRDSKQHYDHGDGDAGTDRVFTGVELEYRSCLYRDDIAHPDHLTQLILVDGIDEPVIERDSPYQTLTENGTLTPDSLIGFSIHPFSVRKMTDSAYVPSDGTMIRPLENELDVCRTQNVQFRDAIGLRYITNLPAEILAKITRSPIGGIISVPDEAFQGEGGAFKPLDAGSMPRENLTIADYIDRDLDQTISLDKAGSGVGSDGASTATEQQIMSANQNARLDKERATILKQYIKGVTKFSTLLQRYLPLQDAIAIVGPQRAQAWDAWRKSADSRLAFTAMPDSALRVDQAVDRKSAQDLYSFLANDPYVQKGRGKLLEKLLRKHHIDPTGIVQAPDPAKPEPPKLSFSFKGEDLVGPQAVIVLGIAEQLGIQVKPEWVTLAQAALHQDQLMAAQVEATKPGEAPKGDTRHGGKLPQQESLSKHAADKTGAMQGTGAPAAMGAAGGMLQ